MPARRARVGVAVAAAGLPVAVASTALGADAIVERPWVTAAGVAAVALAAASPFVLRLGGRATTVTVTELPLVAIATLLGPAACVATVAAGGLASPRRPAAQVLLATATRALAAAVAAGLYDALAADRTDAASLATAAAFAALAYALVATALDAAAGRHHDRATDRLPVHLAVSALAGLAGLVAATYVRTAGPGFGLLLAAPGGLLLMAAAATREARRHEHRLHDVIAAALALAGAGCPGDVDAVLHGRGLAIHDHRPRGGEVATRLDGERWLVAPAGGDRGLVDAVAACARAAVERVAARRALRDLAFTDPLTGLPNRRAFEEELARRSPGAVAVVDIDGLEQVNDTLGHAAGDELLARVADRLRAGARDGELVARIGGDEFAVLTATPDGALPARMRDAVAAPIAIASRRVTVGASVGTAVAPGDGHDGKDLLRVACARMEADKRARRARRADASATRAGA